MNDHSPKTMALLAFDGDLLSDKGTARLLAHLDGCDVCRRELAAIRLYGQLEQEATTASEQGFGREPDWSRMELALRREAKSVAGEIKEQASVSTHASRGMLLGAVMAAAACVLVFVSQTTPSPSTVGTTANDPSTNQVRDGFPMMAAVTAVGGDVTTTELGVLSPVAVGDALAQGAELRTGEQGQVHLALVRPEQCTGAECFEVFSANFSLGPLTRLRTDKLRNNSVELELIEGTVASAVGALSDDKTYRVKSGGWEARVVGTLFRVSMTDGKFGVRVDEGTVDVYRDGVLVRRLSAPDTFFSAGGPVMRPVGVADGPALSFGALPQAERIEVSSQQGMRFSFSAARPFSLGVPGGELTVRGFMGADVVFEQVMTALDDSEFRPEELTGDAPPVRAGTLSTQLIQPVVRAGMRRLQACQEQEARRGEQVVGRFGLRITVGITGDVVRASLQGPPAPEAFRECVLGQARDWLFPPPTGGSVTFQQPVSFRTRAPQERY